VSTFTYVGIVFITVGSFKQSFDVCHGNALKRIFKLKSVFNKFPSITVSDTFD